jgi:ubiquinone/menaquinone biosynthesis C-methylase UbiE
MASTDAVFTGSIPAMYDELLVPIFFEPYAEDLAGRVGDLTAGAVLETAAGTGVVTRALARALSEQVRIVATDVNEAMLRLAERSAPRPITFQRADAQRLPFADGEFDAVVCQFGVIFFPDRDAAYREAHRVLAPGGRFLFNTWDRLEHNQTSLVVARAVADEIPHDPPRFIERIPFGYYDDDRIRADLQRAGFESVTIDVVERVTVCSARSAAVGLCVGTPFRGAIEERAPGRLDAIAAKAAEALEALAGPEGLQNRMRGLVVTARRA